MKNVAIEAGALKSLLEAIDDVAWWMHHRTEDDEEAAKLLARLRDAKHAVEVRAKEEPHE